MAQATHKVIIVIYSANMFALINDAEKDKINLTSTPFYISRTDLSTH